MGGEQEPGGGVTHRYTRDYYLLTYLNAAVYYLVHLKFDLCIFSNKSGQNSLLEVTVK